MNDRFVKAAIAILLILVYQVSAKTVWINNVDVIPIQPLNTELITFNIAGETSNGGAKIESEQFFDTGTVFQMDIYISMGCTDEIGSWTYSKQIGPLPEGTYTLEIRGFDYFQGTLQDTYTTEFNVVPEPGTLLLLAFGLINPRFRRFIKSK